ncbi:MULTISPECIES: AAA family ATPase [environmental samples]|jgi:cytidylate kinase|uniref:cytidylate kinase-like family protein n=1 Tax=environmental samples TaxID=876090 RepID=UPI000334B7A4|nr:MULTISPECIES: cytidylate kinase-like family protein [environmental samples]CDC69344.1 putative uncharacterized protein [Oscillibacter sp. CAG:155]
MNEIITIGRQFGAGGRELGKRLSKELQIPYYDKELLSEAAKLSGLSEKFLNQEDERVTNSLLYSLVMGTCTLTGQPSLEELGWDAQRKAILSVADKGGCIIVGRCADYVLRDRPNLLRLFVMDDMDRRIRHVSQRDQITPAQAEQKIRKMEKMRAAYYNSRTDSRWGAAENYDLCLNISRIGRERALHIILDQVRDKK